jgi:Protein of unknown function (DUF2442)
MGFEEEFKKANKRAQELQANVPRAVAARYDRRTGRVVIGLSSGLEVGFLPASAQGLTGASAGELEQIEITPSGYGIHFPKLDADLYLPALLQGFTGSRKWMASGLGRVGGASRSRAKVAAARKNGKLGGTAASEGEGMRVGWRLDRQTIPYLQLCSMALRNGKVKKRPQDPGTKHRKLGHPAVEPGIIDSGKESQLVSHCLCTCEERVGFLRIPLPS